VITALASPNRASSSQQLIDDVKELDSAAVQLNDDFQSTLYTSSTSYLSYLNPFSSSSFSPLSLPLLSLSSSSSSPPTVCLTLGGVEARAVRPQDLTMPFTGDILELLPTATVDNANTEIDFDGRRWVRLELHSPEVQSQIRLRQVPTIQILVEQITCKGVDMQTSSFEARVDNDLATTRRCFPEMYAHILWCARLADSFEPDMQVGKKAGWLPRVWGEVAASCESGVVFATVADPTTRVLSAEASYWFELNDQTISERPICRWMWRWKRRLVYNLEATSTFETCLFADGLRAEPESD